MSPSSSTLNSLILSYLYRTIDLSALRDKSAPFCISAGEKDSGNAADLRAANLLIADFTDIDEGLITERDLRDSLTALLFSPSTSTSRYLEIKREPINTTTTGTEIKRGESAPIEFFGTGRALAHA